MVKLTRIYTRGGDKGLTSLGDRSRRPKDDLRIEAYGSVDEAGAAIGLARLHTKGKIDAMLARVQNDLFDVGADLAAPGDGGDDGATPRLRTVQSQIDRLEREIDALNPALGPLASFVLSGGTPAAAALHFARTVTRRAERLAFALARKEKGKVNPLALRYLNRLSDHLFVLARAANAMGRKDVLWVPGFHR